MATGRGGPGRRLGRSPLPSLATLGALLAISALAGRGAGRLGSASNKRPGREMSTKLLKFMAKNIDTIKHAVPSIRPTRERLDILERRERQKRIMKIKPDYVRDVMEKIPKGSDGALRTRDWSDSEYEEIMQAGDRFHALMKRLGPLPDERYVKKIITRRQKSRAKPIKLKPWDAETSPKKALQPFDFAKLKLPRRVRRRMERATEAGLDRPPAPHPGLALVPEPRAHAELMIQIAQHEAKRDPELAFQWYQMGAEKGSVDAMFHLACHYANGEEPLVDTDHEKAFGLFKKAADLGHVRSKYYTGLGYMMGDGIEVDHAMALTYLKSAEESGDLDAKHFVGFAYEMGFGVKKNVTRAMGIFQEAANLGHRTSKKKLANIERRRQKIEKLMRDTRDPKTKKREQLLAAEREKEFQQIRKEEKKRRRKLKVGDESSDPDTWNATRIEAERRKANESIARELMLEERAKKRDAKRKFVKLRSRNAPSWTGELPPILLPDEIDGTLMSSNKVYLSGRFNPAEAARNNLLNSGILGSRDLDVKEYRRMKAKTKRKLPRAGRFYKDAYH